MTVAMRLLLFSALLVLVTTSQASPDSRSLEQHDGESLLERETDRPYAPELFPRAALLEATPHLKYGKRDAVMVPTAQKRQNAWGGLWKRHWSDESAASQLLFTSKSDWCRSSSMCANGQFCQPVASVCVEQLAVNAACSEDASCQTGYCSQGGVCQVKQVDRKRCYDQHSACLSGYCSVQQSICKPRQSVGARCIVTAACHDGLNCINGACHASALPSPSTHDAPTKRDLSQLFASGHHTLPKQLHDRLSDARDGWNQNN